MTESFTRLEHEHVTARILLELKCIHRSSRSLGCALFDTIKLWHKEQVSFVIVTSDLLV